MALKKSISKKKKAVKKQPPNKRLAVKKKTLKKPVKKTVKKKSLKAKTRVVKVAKEKALGEITHYFPKVRAAVIKLNSTLNVGESIKIKGHTTDFTQVIASMQIDRVPVQSGKKGQEIGLLVNSRVRQQDKVFKI